MRLQFKGRRRKHLTLLDGPTCTWETLVPFTVEVSGVRKKCPSTPWTSVRAGSTDAVLGEPTRRQGSPWTCRDPWQSPSETEIPIPRTWTSSFSSPVSPFVSLSCPKVSYSRALLRGPPVDWSDLPPFLSRRWILPCVFGPPRFFLKLLRTDLVQGPTTECKVPRPGPDTHPFSNPHFPISPWTTLQEHLVKSPRTKVVTTFSPEYPSKIRLCTYHWVQTFLWRPPVHLYLQFP